MMGNPIEIVVDKPIAVINLLLNKVDAAGCVIPQRNFCMAELQ
jgi:hypothetical protein